MKNFLTIWKRELSACFLSPVAYVTIVFFLFVSGVTFMMEVIGNEGKCEPLSVMLFAAITVWLTILITVVTMRLFAEEKRTGTIETLMTAPITEEEIVLGKYAGALTFVMIVVAPAIANIFLLARLTPGISIADIDAGSVVGGCVIIFLVSALCVSVGLIVSLMTRNQIVSALSCLCAIWAVLLFGHVISTLPGGSDKIAEYISPLSHIEDFSRGLLDTRAMVFYVSGTIFVLFAAIRALESRRWR